MPSDNSDDDNDADWPNADTGESSEDADAGTVAVPNAARANVEPTSDTTEKATDMLGQLQEAQREGLATPKKSRRPTLDTKVSLDTPHTDLTRRLSEAGVDYGYPNAIMQAIHDLMSNG